MTMQVSNLQVDRAQALELYRAYKKHQHYSEPIDDEIRRVYQLIARGRVVIRALESVKSAGLGADGLPKLAICRADARECFLQISTDGQARFWVGERPPKSRERARVIDFPAGSFTGVTKHRGSWNAAKAIVPLVPVHIRPKRAMENYHILWEAEWTRIVPKDPMLLRRIGKGDMWLVLAAWDLTEVERAALASRLNG